MSDAPLMPKATAVWLVENTSLTFDQIAEFCKLHPLEVKGIADGEVATGIKGYDPISTGQLTREEIAEAEKDPSTGCNSPVSKVRMPEFKKPRGARYTPLSRRQDRPNAMLWLLRNHPELKDAQIMRLVGTTKHTLQAIRERTHWNSANLQPMDPVTLGLCSQIDLDFEVNRAAKDRPKVEEPRGQTLVSGRGHHRQADARPRKPARSVRRADAEAGGGEDRRRRGVRQAQGERAARRGVTRPSAFRGRTGPSGRNRDQSTAPDRHRRRYHRQRPEDRPATPPPSPPDCSGASSRPRRAVVGEAGARIDALASCGRG